MYQDLYDKAKNIIKQDACMKFYDILKPFYLETGGSGISLGVTLLQVKDGTNWHTAWIGKVPLLLFHQGSICNHTPQIIIGKD